MSPLRAEQLTKLVDPIWLQVLRPLLPNLVAYLTDLSPPAKLDPAQERVRLVEALAHFLSGWAQITPLVLILEDLHWADLDTLEILTRLSQRLDDYGVVILGTYRGEEARAQPAIWERLQALDRAALRGRLTPTRLDAAKTGELIRRSLGLARVAPLFEERLHRETDGNPLFVLETLRTLYDEGLLARDASGEWRTPWDETTRDYAEMPLPPAVERVIARRIAQLAPDLRETLKAAAILGTQFDFALLSLVLGGSEGTISHLETKMVLAAIAELVRRRFWEELPQAYRFSHESAPGALRGDRRARATGVASARRRGVGETASRSDRAARASFLSESGVGQSRSVQSASGRPGIRRLRQS